MQPPSDPPRGMALITVLVVLGLVMVMALGLAMVVSIHMATQRHHRDSQELWLAARGALEVAAIRLDVANWSDVLTGTSTAPGVDGAAVGSRRLPDGGSLDLNVETSLLTCGSRMPCTSAQTHAITADRPWAENNPRWRLFLFGPLASLLPLRFTSAVYVLVWVADDGREVDGDPERDAAAGEPGHGILRLRSRAIGTHGSRRDAEVEVVRVCRPDVDGGPCRPGLRLHGLRDVRQVVP